MKFRNQLVKTMCKLQHYQGGQARNKWRMSCEKQARQKNTTNEKTEKRKWDCYEKVLKTSRVSAISTKTITGMCDICIKNEQIANELLKRY